MIKERVKERLEITDDSKDILISSIVKYCKQSMLLYMNRNEDQWNDFFDSVLVASSVETFWRLGSEGQSTYSEGGLSVSYTQNLISYSILDRYRLARVV